MKIFKLSKIPFKENELTKDVLFLVKTKNILEREIFNYHLAAGKLWKMEGFYRPRFDCEINAYKTTICGAQLGRFYIIKKALKFFENKKNENSLCPACVKKSKDMKIYSEEKKDDGGTGNE